MARNDYAVPLHALDLSGLAPATVLTADFDPLADVGEASADRLDDAGVAVEQRHYDSQIHGFCSLYERIDDGREAVGSVAARLRASLAASA